MSGAEFIRLAREINFDPQDLAEMAQAIAEVHDQIDWEDWDFPPNSVALTEAIPEYDLVKNQVGSILEKVEPDSYRVQFKDNEGRPGVILTLSAAQLFMVPSRGYGLFVDPLT